MTAANPSRLGQVNQTGDADALFLKVFGGEVMTQFETGTKFLDKHTIRTIASGKSAQFPATGRIGGGYHTPGDEILGLKVNHAERVITIDDLLISHAFVANIDEAKNHYDVRSIYTKEMGGFLSRSFDTNIAQVGILASRASATVTGGFGGSKVTDAAVGTNATNLADGLFAAAQKLDEKDIPESDPRYAFVKPAQYYLLVKSKDAINKDWGGAGVYSDGTVFRVAGLEIVKTNQLPSTNVTTGPTAYQGNFTNTVALVMHPGAVGTVKLLDLAMESEYQTSRQGTLMVAKYAMGHGILRPECAVELASA